MAGIQLTEVQKLRKKWVEENPDASCPHDQGELKEYYLGGQTGDIICITCYDVVRTR